MIKEQRINIRYAIQWAENKIVNSKLLYEEEIKSVIQKLSQEKMSFNNAEEALEISNINVLSNEVTVIYMIKIPLTLEEILQKIMLKPVLSKENVVIKINSTEILKSKNKIYGIEKQYKDSNRIDICSKNQIIDLRNETCIIYPDATYPEYKK